MLYWSKCLIGVSSFWNGLLFFFRPPAYLFAKKRTLNNELTKGGLRKEQDEHYVRLSGITSFIVDNVGKSHGFWQQSAKAMTA